MVPKIGDVISFYYHKGDNKWRIGKVTSVRDTHENPLTFETRLRGQVNRTRHLVTCVMADKTYRSFYIDNVRWSKVGAFRLKLLRFGGITFETA